jgi:hypothetical protein
VSWAECEPPSPDSNVAARNARPIAVSATPIHSRRVTDSPKNLSAATVRNTRPPAMIVCTSEIGASASAPTCRTHPPMAMRIPSTYARDRNSTNVDQNGRFQSTGGDSTAPRCL